MALYRKPKTVKEWLFNNQPVTWFAHGLITILFGTAIYSLTGSLFYKACASTLIVLAFFVPKEILKDKKDHEKHGDWNKRDYMGMTPMLDMYGDLGVPCVVAVSDIITFLVSLLH